MFKKIIFHTHSYVTRGDATSGGKNTKCGFLLLSFLLFISFFSFATKNATKHCKWQKKNLNKYIKCWFFNSIFLDLWFIRHFRICAMNFLFLSWVATYFFWQLGTVVVMTEKWVQPLLKRWPDMVLSWCQMNVWMSERKQIVCTETDKKRERGQTWFGNDFLGVIVILCNSTVYLVNVMQRHCRPESLPADPLCEMDG